MKLIAAKLIALKLVATLAITFGVWWLRGFLQISSFMSPALALWGCVCVFWGSLLGGLGGVRRKRGSSGRSPMEVVWMLAGAICWLVAIFILWRET